MDIKLFKHIDLTTNSFIDKNFSNSYHSVDLRLRFLFLLEIIANDFLSLQNKKKKHLFSAIIMYFSLDVFFCNYDALIRPDYPIHFHFYMQSINSIGSFIFFLKLYCFLTTLEALSCIPKCS